MFRSIKLLWIWAILPDLIALKLQYHSTQELEGFLHAINRKYPSITHLYYIGGSVAGIKLWVLAIGKYPKVHTVGIPDVKYIANIHGDEVVGREMLLQLIEHLVKMYKHDATITRLINNARIHIMPSMNPDGFEITQHEERSCTYSIGRYNKERVDLNRNFPDAFENSTSATQPETKAVMNWILSETFVLSISLHGGAVVASYPYDNKQTDKQPAGYSKCPDDDVFVYLAKNYSYNHLSMFSGEECERTPYFQDGITNGAEWYHFSGIKGQVLTMDGAPIENAIVEVQGRENINPFRTNKWGEYYRLLLPGTYILNVTVPGFGSNTTEFQVLNDVENFSALVFNFHFNVNATDATSSKHSIQQQHGTASSKQQNAVLLISIVICSALIY
ncbi:carboxypeptidase M-like isoform X2 [Scyliorhinus torazame]|uniref:carboxypeptidase M-like isoform X2 n=1 Tax=Scyliorhinus torazame TaxID=75743 RepID=UPI003B5AC774